MTIKSEVLLAGCREKVKELERQLEMLHGKTKSRNYYIAKHEFVNGVLEFMQFEGEIEPERGSLKGLLAAATKFFETLDWNAFGKR